MSNIKPISIEGTPLSQTIASILNGQSQLVFPTCEQGTATMTVHLKLTYVKPGVYAVKLDKNSKKKAGIGDISSMGHPVEPVHFQGQKALTRMATALHEAGKLKFPAKGATYIAHIHLQMTWCKKGCYKAALVSATHPQTRPDHPLNFLFKI